MKILLPAKVVLATLAITIINSEARAAQLLPQSSSINEAVKAISNVISKDLAADNCKEKLSSLNTALFDIKYNQFPDIGNVVENNGSDAVSVLFSTRATLNEKLREFVGGINPSNKFKSKAQMVECVDHMRRSHRNIRSLEDRIAISAYKKQGKLKDLGIVGLPSADLGLKPFEDNQWPNLMVNKQIQKDGILKRSDLRSGDFFMTKGTTFASSVISRIGRVDNQFSHLAVVYIDDGGPTGDKFLFGEKNKGKIYVVESEPDFGLQIVSLDHFFKNDKNRLVHYRLNWVDNSGRYTAASEVAAKAARFLAERADVRENTFDKSGTDDTLVSRLDVVEKATGVRKIERIGYNFGMDMNVESSQFCSQIISWGLKNACNQPGVQCESFPDLGNNGVNIFPLVQSEIVTKNNGFAKLLDLTISETFAPADAEVEPRFTMLGEWRDVSYAAYTRGQDMATTKLFQLMEEGHYEFIESDELKAFADVTTKMLKDAGKMPEDMPQGLTKGSLYTAFLTWYAGPGPAATGIIEGLVKKAEPKAVLNGMVSLAGLSPLTAETLLTTFGSDTVEQKQKIEKLVARIIRHNSLVEVIRQADEKAYLDKGFFLTEKQMGLAIDLFRKQDCEIFKALEGGEKLSEVDDLGAPVRNTVAIHDLVRRNTKDLNTACEVKLMPLTNF